jgi:hypothetical protein
LAWFVEVATGKWLLEVFFWLSTLIFCFT